jgi:hypothetical protein
VVTREFRRFSGACALGAAGSGFLYSVSFVVVSRVAARPGALLSGLFLLTGGLLATVVMVALYRLTRDTDSGFATWAVLLGVAGALGSAMHGGFDLANSIHPPDAISAFPSEVDPRGLMTFGVTGLAVLVFARLLLRARAIPDGLAAVGLASAVVLEVLYLGRLVILDATNPVIVAAALLGGFIVNPLWYGWLGVHLLRGQGPTK